MKKYLLLFCFISVFCHAQNYRAIYDLRFKPNKDKDSILSDQYALDIFPKLNKSHFFNYNYYKNDSIMTVFQENSKRNGGVNINMESLPKTKLPLVFINEKAKQYSLKTIDGDSYKFPDFNPINWKILNETKKIRNWNCQKAETNFLGRNWTAWFTTEISFADGPYKFSGLPGLIVEVFDTKNNYYFSLDAFYKNPGLLFLPKIYEKPIEVSKKQYEKAYSNYVQDPAFKLRQGTIVDESGNVFHINGGFSKKFISEVTQERLNKIKDFNNPLELE